MVLPVLLYGSEYWEPTKNKDRSRIRAGVTEFLRSVNNGSIKWDRIPNARTGAGNIIVEYRSKWKQYNYDRSP